MPCLRVLFVIAVALPLHAQGAVTITLPADRDNTLYESATAALSNGSGDCLFTGVEATGIRRALVRFDVIGTVPAGARILSASLRLYVEGTSTKATMSIGAHRLLDDWGESTSVSNGPQGSPVPAALFDATWRHRFHPTTAWMTVGGDYVANASTVSLTTASGFQFWYPTTALIADVQAFLDQPVLNYGWLFRCSVEGAVQTRCFASRECPNPPLQPQLTIVYLPLGSVMSLGTGCIGSGAQRLELWPQGLVGPGFRVALSGGRPGVVAAYAISYRMAVPPRLVYPGCSLLLDGSYGMSTHALVLLDAGGGSSIPFAVSNSHTGLELGLQSMALDPWLPQRYVLSNALFLRAP